MNNANSVATPILGKVIGGFIGLLLFNLPGLIIGVMIGHLFDKRSVRFMPDNKVEQSVYLDNLYAVMGHIAKLDGQVSQREINYAKMVMQRMSLSEGQRDAAMKAFYRGKRSDFDLDQALVSIRRSTHHRRKLLYFFINAQVQMVYADGVVKEELKPVLQRMARQLGLMPLNFNYYDAIFGWRERWQHHQYGGGSSYQGHQQQTGGGSYQHYQQGAGGARQNSGFPLSEAYRMLGISNKASDAEVKKAYRKLMSKYHPDKLMSKGLSDKEMKAATEKVQKIKAAYEQIRSSRNF